MAKLPIYLDYHSTTPVDPRVLEAMLPYFSGRFGNASSKGHEYGWVAEAAVENARARIADLIHASSKEIIFTSGATESINLALKGIAESYRSRGNHIITVTTEHPAVLDTCRGLEQRGYRVTYLPVDASGKVQPSQVLDAITDETILVSIMAANNEIGTIAPLAEIGRVCRSRGVLFHSDATQAVGRIPIDMTSMQVDLMSFSAHKMYGPKGVGALYIRSAHPMIRLTAQMQGGGHERGLRSGTLNVPGIVGMGEAARIGLREMGEEARRCTRLRDRLVEGIMAQLDDVRVNGHPTDRLPNNANIMFSGTRAERLMMEMKDLAVSSGSACSTGSPEPSHVLRAIGLPKEEILASIRFGLGRFTTEEEIEYAINRIVSTVKAARERAGVIDRAHA
jgi:cysteine desulfurase